MIRLREIYFVNADALAREFRDGNVDEAIALKHLIVSLILSGIGYENPLSVDFNGADLPGFVTFAGVAMFLLVSIIAYYGTWLTFQANRKGDGSDFFMRFAALSLPIGIQLMVLFLFVGAILAFIAYLLATQFGAIGGGLSVALFYVAAVIFQGAFFLRMRSCILISSGASID